MQPLSVQPLQNATAIAKPSFQTMAAQTGGNSSPLSLSTMTGQGLSLNSSPGLSNIGSGMPQNTFGGVNQFVSGFSQQPAAMPTFANTGNTQNTQYSGSATNPTGSLNPVLGQAINSNFDHQIQGYHDQIGLLGNNSNVARDGLQGVYQSQADSLTHQNQQGNENLDQSQNQLDQSKARSFRDLTNQMRGLINGYSNQVGTYGAGSSSAIPVINYALAQQGNRQYGDLNQQTANQQTGLNAQRNNLGINYQDQMNSLAKYRDQQLGQINSNYANTLQQLQASLGTAQGYRAQTLATYGQYQAAQDALNHLQALDAEYNKQVEGIKSAYQPIDQGQYDLSQYTKPYALQPLSAGQMQGLNLSNIQAQQDQTTSPVNLLKHNDQINY